MQNEKEAWKSIHQLLGEIAVYFPKSPAAKKVQQLKKETVAILVMLEKAEHKERLAELESSLKPTKKAPKAAPNLQKAPRGMKLPAASAELVPADYTAVEKAAEQAAGKAGWPTKGYTSTAPKGGAK